MKKQPIQKIQIYKKGLLFAATILMGLALSGCAYLLCGDNNGGGLSGLCHGGRC